MQLSVGVWQPYTGGGTEYCCSPAREPRAAVSGTESVRHRQGFGCGVGERAEPRTVRSGQLCDVRLTTQGLLLHSHSLALEALPEGRFSLVYFERKEIRSFK